MPKPLPDLKKKIVLIEDEATLADLLELRLEEEGFEVYVARDGAKGAQLVQDVKPDLVLLDMMLPILNGFGVLEALSTQGILSHMPVIIISNSGQPIEIERAKKFGVRDYIIKVNFDPEDVVRKVAQVLEGKTHSLKKKARKTAAKEKMRHVLSVEDDSVLSDALERKFEEKGYDLHKAVNGENALRILEKETIDAILLDIILPDMDGFAVLQKIKENPHTKNIPVIIVSNLGQKEEIERGLKSGASGYIVKANSLPKDILEKVESVISKN